MARSARGALSNAPGARGLLRRFRRAAGHDPAADARRDAQLAAHESAIRDILPALQEVQGPRVEESRREIAELRERLERIEEHLPELLGAIASSSTVSRRLQQQLTDVWSQLGGLNDIWTRVETIRRELLFEVRYHDPDQAGVAEPKILDEEKVAAARRSGLRLNLGCGHLPLDDYVNVDMRDLPGVDVVAPVDALPFEAGEAEELFSAHLVEHFPEERLVREVLPHWVSRIRPGGTFRAVLPDAGAMLTAFSAGDMPYEDLREVLYGGQEYDGDFHFNMYTTASLTEILREAGLVDIVVEAEGRRNGACLEMQVAARTPG